jgi:glycerol kinase
VSRYILAIDQGTTNTKALAVDQHGRMVASASAPMAVTYPQPGWAEQSAEDIWQSVRTVIVEIVAAVGADSIAGTAISNQRESIVVWDRATLAPIAPCVIWQCRRSAERCAAIRAAGHEAAIVARTGLGIDPLFPAAKLGWILDNVPAARLRAERGELAAGTVDSWLIARLTAGRVHATDFSNASRTQLLDTEHLRWDPELGRIFDVPLSVLPEVRNSDANFGTVAAGVTALAEGTPIRAAIGDSHAALYGHGVRGPGFVKATYGTGSSLMTITPTRIASRHGLSGTIGWATADGVAHALEGNISVSGQAAAFMGEMLGLADAGVLAELAATVPDSNGVAFIPALVGLGAPHWRDDARGLVSGLSLGTKPAHLARAAIEAIALQVMDVYRAMESDLGQKLGGLSADGGASRNDMLMQLEADLISGPVRRSRVAELSAIGAAMLAARSLWPESRFEMAEPDAFAPNPGPSTAALRAGWRNALALLLGDLANA